MSTADTKSGIVVRELDLGATFGGLGDAFIIIAILTRAFVFEGIDKKGKPFSMDKVELCGFGKTYELLAEKDFYSWASEKLEKGGGQEIKVEISGRFKMNGFNMNLVVEKFTDAPEA